MTQAATGIAEHPPEDQKVYAGKYKGEEQLEKAIHEISNKLDLGLPEEVDIIGGTFGGDAEKAEGYYKQLQIMQGSRSETAPEESGTGEGEAVEAEKAPPAPESTTNETGLHIDEGAGAEPEDEGLVGVISKAGLDGTTLLNQFDEYGSLTDSQYSALAKQGWSKGMANDVAEMQVYRRKREREAVLNNAVKISGGTKEGFDELMKWGRENLNVEQKVNLNRQLDNSLTYETALESLMYRRQQSGGAPSPAGESETIEATTGAPMQSGGCSSPKDWWETHQLAVSGDEAALSKISRTSEEASQRYRQTTPM